MKNIGVVIALGIALVGCGGESSTSDSPEMDGAASNGAATSNGTTATSNGTTATSNGTTAAPMPDCVPSKAIWEATVAPMVDGACGRCHGTTPNFGAPYALVDYDDLLAGEEGQRKIDRIVARMADDTMPPPTSPRPPHYHRDTIVGWASCGAEHPDPTAGLEVNREVFGEPEALPAHDDIVELLADDFAVDKDTLNLYQCFDFPAPVDSDRFIKRIEAVIDESRVLHHVTLEEYNGGDGPAVTTSCNGVGGKIIYAWAPGGNAVQFPDGGGMRIKPGKRYTVEIHYNNGAGLEGIRDNSGIRLYLGDLEGPEYIMFETGSGIPFMSVNPGEKSESTKSCTINQDVQLLTGFPHMHEIGDEFHESITRVDGTTESLIDLTGWNFEAQLFYDLPIALKEGDKITTTCVYNNTTDKPVRGGLRTEDEMCFDFIYATPPGSHCR